MRKIGAILGNTALAAVVFSPLGFISTCRLSGTITTAIT
jgi:hypothetical protein